MALKDTLNQLQQNAAQEAEWQRGKPQFIADWRQAVADFMAQVRGYLAAYEADGSMTISAARVDISEELLGNYQAPTLSIAAGSVTVVVAPKARMVMGAVGLIEMYRKDRPAPQNCVQFLRMAATQTDETLVWKIKAMTMQNAVQQRAQPSRLVRQQPTRQFGFVPLDDKLFEECLDGLLR